MQLAERVHRVRLLLGSLEESYPTPQGALRPLSGPSTSRYLPCETCRTTGRRRVRGGFVVCLVCGGTGEKRRERHDVPWDAYMELPVADANDLPREPEPARVPPPEEAGFGWERALAAHERYGSYKELRRQLDWLREAHPRRYQLVRAVLIEHQERDLSARSALELDLAVVSIALRMRTVRIPRWLREPVQQTQATVATLAALGLRAGEIARILGITKKAARRQLKRLESRQAGVPARAT